MDKRTALSERREAARKALAKAEREIFSLLEVIDGDSEHDRGQRWLIYTALDALSTSYRCIRHVRHSSGKGNKAESETKERG